MRFLNLVLCSMTLASQLALADCQSQRPAAPDDLKAFDPATLFQKMIAACEGGKPEDYFSLQTTDFRKSNLKRSRGEQQAMLAVNCKTVVDIAKKIGGDPQNAMYILKHGPQEQCGHKESVLFIHANDGASLAKMKVAIEADALKIDEF